MEPPETRAPTMQPDPDESPHDDALLAAAARSGSMAALGELFTRHGAMVHSLAYRVLGSAADAEDVLQDVFVMLPEALQDYAERGRFAGWLRRVATLHALMKVRARTRRREELLDDADLLPAAAGGGDALRRIAVQRALAAMPASLRVVWVLKEIEGYSHEEIGEMLGISGNASAARNSRAWKFMREAVGEP